ncbi:PG0541 family transporter-associated protein [Fusobacterium sp.]|uniref:PG0541 family transporter-associated protein n=1 Tax=Fusobacterium sp. TaxID=68766 RepID=UPI002624C394|nr:PG0541 family transporter-associated protein [Fusobacterium sp.]
MSNNDFYCDFKLIMVYINEAQKSRLEEFFEEIRFYYYAVQRKLETVWSDKIKHKNTTVWPGTDCIFMLSVPSTEVDKMLKYLKTFRMSLPEGIVMSIGILPMDRVIPRVYFEDIEVDEKLLEKLKNKYTK